MNFNEFRPGLKARVAHLSLAAASAAALLTSGVAVVTAMPAQAAIARDVAQALKLRLPKTPIDALDCTTFAPWCEVVSGESLFYIDEAARYLFVGRLYDLEERRDVTAARLLELNPDLLAAGAARAAGRAETHSPEARTAPAKTMVDLSGLPKDGAGSFIAKKEKSDVVHDLLAFLAERMLEMNKQKLARRSGLWRRATANSSSTFFIDLIMMA